MLSPAHQRRKILREENLLCLAGNFPSFSGENNKDNMVHLLVPKHWEALALHRCGRPRGWLWLGASPQASAELPLRTGRLGWCVLSSASAEATQATQKRCWVQAKASSKPGYFCFPFRVPCHPGRGDIFRLIHIYVYAGWVWSGNQASLRVVDKVFDTWQH